MPVSTLAYLKALTFKLGEILCVCCLLPGSVLPWRRRETLCTSGFVDDVISTAQRRGMGVTRGRDSLARRAGRVAGCVPGGTRKRDPGTKCAIYDCLVFQNVQTTHYRSRYCSSA